MILNFYYQKDAQFLNKEYTYFVKVISGMDIINKLAIGDRFLDTTTPDKVMKRLPNGNIELDLILPGRKFQSNTKVSIRGCRQC